MEGYSSEWHLMKDLIKDLKMSVYMYILIYSK